MLFHQSGLTSRAKQHPGLTNKLQAQNSFLTILNSAYSFIRGFCHITDNMAFVQKVEKKSDLDDMMNEVQEKIQEKDAEFTVLLDNVISQNFKDTQISEMRKLKQFVYALFTQEHKKSS